MGHQEKEGVIKYNRRHFIPAPPLPAKEFEELEKWRKLLYCRGFIGVYPDGLGFGNVSQRINYHSIRTSTHPQFLITGSQTGHLSALDGRHYARVLDFDLENMELFSMGPVEASSEALTHAAVYQGNKLVNVVIHGHHRQLWQALWNTNYPGTAQNIEYGTRAMALAVESIAQDFNSYVLIMKGHADGILAWGPSFSEALGPLDSVMAQYLPR
jgi:L-ribulose-5-phosphate 4-epimerase